MTMTEDLKAAYVAGFLFSSDAADVALIRKERPAWQHGKLNAIGGRILPGEDSIDAMRREFREETGIDISKWHRFATLGDVRGWRVEFFVAFDDLVYDCRTMTDEVVSIYTADQLPIACIPNLEWLVPLALYALRQPNRFEFKEVLLTSSEESLRRQVEKGWRE